MDEPTESQAVSTHDLFAGRLQAITTKTKKKRSSPRAELIGYFFNNAKKGWTSKRPLTVIYVGMCLAYLKTEDLYAFKSQLEDRCRTLGWIAGGDLWCEFFWGCLKPNELQNKKPFARRAKSTRT